MILQISMFSVAILNTLLIHSLLTRKRSWAQCGFIFVLKVILGYIYLATMNLFAPTLGNATVGLLYFIYYYLVFEESVAIKMFTMASIWLFSMTLMNVSLYFTKMLFTDVTEISQASTYLLRTAFELILLPVFYFLIRTKYIAILKSLPNKTAYLLTIYPFFSVLALNYDYYYLRPLENNFHTAINTFLLITFIILGYTTILLSIYAANTNNDLKLKNQTLQQQMEFQHQNYKLLNENIQIRRALEHDFRHHIAAIKAFLNEKNADVALSYIEKLNNLRINENLPANCENFTIDSLLKYYMSLALDNNINFKTKLNIPNEIPIDVIDLCVILGNCIENAIEACERCPDDGSRYINIVSEIFGENLVIKIKNSFDGVLSIDDNGLLSSKGERHGLGLSNVKQLIQKYSGSFEMLYDANAFEISIVV